MAEAGSLLGLIECALQVGDFGDAVNWPTPGEIAHKSVQVSLWGRTVCGQFELCPHRHMGFTSFQSTGS